MTNEALAKITLYLHATWASYRPDDATAFALRRNLGDLDPETVLAAIDILATDHPQFAPNPQTIRACAHGLTRGAEPNKGDGWGELMREIRRVGYIGSPEFTDDRTHRIVEQLGGWTHICKTWMVNDEMANRAHFFKLWDELGSRDRHDTAVGIGQSDQGQLGA